MKKFLCGFLALVLLWPKVLMAEDVLVNPVAEEAPPPAEEESAISATEEVIVADPLPPEPPQETVPQDPVQEIMPADPISPISGPIIEVVDPVQPEPTPETVPSDPIQEPVQTDPITPPIPDVQSTPQLEPQPEPPSEPQLAPQLGPQLIISEVMAGTEVNPEKDSWVELYNPGEMEVNLSGWQIRGVTEGNGWVGLGETPISPKGYFLMSYYTNSRYSALAVAPQLQKDSLLFAIPEINIELKNPADEVVDWAIWTKEPSINFQSLERMNPAGDGADPVNWKLADCHRNLKKTATQTFGSPGSPNCAEPLVEIPTDPVTEIQPPETTNETPNQPPIPIIRLQRGTNGMTVNVTAEDSTDPDGDSMDFTWIFDTEHSENSENPSYFTYEAPGTKTIVLTITDARGASASASIVFEASQPVSTSSASASAPTQSSKAYGWGDMIIEQSLPNPEGKDDGQEKIVLRNRLAEGIDLSGWTIENAKGKRKAMPSKTVPPDGILEIGSSEFGLDLVNSADRLSLYDGLGNKIDELTWEDAAEGVVIFNPEFLKNGVEAAVTRVVDGDTFHIIIGGEELVVRLIGVDAPESVHPTLPPQPFGLEASEHLKKMIEGRDVALEFEGPSTDVYGRILAYAFLNGEFVNKDLIENGYARAYLKYPFAFKEEFKQTEERARAAKLGLWGVGKIETSDPLDLRDELVELSEAIEMENETDTPSIQCPTEGLRIDVVVPNPNKGEGDEWIRIRNMTHQNICLNGWILDDRTDGGSKPFAIRGGSIAGGATRTFRKNETRLALNNSNDCVSLINPLGKTVDAVCYGKTHPGEKFTHAGGDWYPKARVSKQKIVKKKIPTVVQSVDPETLITEKAEGILRSVDVVKKVVELETEKETLLISFSQSRVDPKFLSSFSGTNTRMSMALRSSGDVRELVSLKILDSGKMLQCENPKSENWFEILILGLLILVAQIAIFIRKGESV